MNNNIIITDSLDSTGKFLRSLGISSSFDISWYLWSTSSDSMANLYHSSILDINNCWLTSSFGYYWGVYSEVGNCKSVGPEVCGQYLIFPIIGGDFWF